jgi:hypothetical protein
VIETKPWYASKTIWAGLIATAVSILGGLLKVDVSAPEQAELATFIPDIIVGVMGIIAVIGRVTAKTKIEKN